MKTKTIFTVSLGIMIFSCGTNTQKNSNEMDKVHGIDVANMHQHVQPGADFYNYANGGWMESAEIPDDESRWGSFSELREMNDEMTLSLVDKALANQSIDTKSDEGKVVKFFSVAMDTTTLDKQGITPIQPMLDRIASISSIEELQEYFIEMEPVNSTFYASYVYSDPKNSNVNAIYLGGGSLGLPDRDYYTEDDEDSVEKREKYVAHIARMLQFTGISEDQANEKAKQIMALETRMAQSMLTKEKRRDPEITYNPKTVEELNKLAPAINWEAYYKGIGASNFDQVIVSQPAYIQEMNNILSQEPLQTIKDYLVWNIVNDAAGYLSSEINEANFDFYGKTLRDLKTQKPRNERVLATTNGVLGEALGKLYVAEYFPKEAKETAVEMVDYLKKAYEKRINQLDWMSDTTKVKAIEKLMAMTVKIGYPDQWKDYSTLEVSDTFYENILNSRTWNFNQDIVKIGKEVDKTEWFMSPQTVNAYYNPLYNEIVFPAAILQPPFFDYKADMAVNFGGMGAVIGHEISHGFDDKGAKYAANGNLENWWTEADMKKFEERGKQLIDQYSAYEPLEGIKVNGEFTLGENIGDLGGVVSAYDGLQLYLQDHGRPDDIDNMNQEQRFFVNWATIWRTKIRDEALKNQIKTDPHSPGYYRAVGPLVNVDAFYKAFAITETDEMYKPENERVRIW